MLSQPGGEIWGIGSGHGGAPVPSPLGMPPGINAATGGMIPRQLMIFPPEIYPIPDAQEFNLEGDIASVGAGTVQIPVATIQLQSGYVGIIRGFSIYIDDMLATTNVLYSLLINGSAPAGYGLIKMFPRAAPSVSNGFESFVRVPDSALISVKAQNIDGGTYIVGAAISGWIWPKSAGDRWISAGY